MLKQWKVSLLDKHGKLDDRESSDPLFKEFEELIKDRSSSVSKAVKIYRSELQKNIIEGLLSSGSCDNEKMSDLTGIKIEVLEAYRKYIFRIDDAFDSKIDFIDYIETGVSYYSSMDDQESIANLNSFLLKRWASALGHEFISWKFKLVQAEYNSADLYNTVMKESFFYHKEKSMGNDDISLQDYLKSSGLLLNSVKGKESIKSATEEDAVLDIEDRLGIIIQDETPPDIIFGSIEGEEFINNAVISDN